MTQQPSVKYRFTALNVGKGGAGYGGQKVLDHRLFVVDADAELPDRAWLASRYRGTVFVPDSKGKLTFAYELVLGRPPTDRERIFYNNTDSLDLRRANLSYVNRYDPTIPQAAFTPCPGFAIERLAGYAEALEEAYRSFAVRKAQWNYERSWAVAKARGSLSKENVVALLHFYSDRFTDEEIAYHTDKRLGTTMDDCVCFLREDLQVKAPSECHIRNILKGEALYVRGHDELYAKVKKLLPTYKSLLVPLPKPSMFKPVQPAN